MSTREDLLDLIESVGTPAYIVFGVIQVYYNGNGYVPVAVSGVSSQVIVCEIKERTMAINSRFEKVKLISIEIQKVLQKLHNATFFLIFLFK